MHNALTIDVEDYFQVTAFAGRVKMADWDNFPIRARENTLRILELLETRSIRATFFILGWLANRSLTWCGKYGPAATRSPAMVTATNWYMK